MFEAARHEADQRTRRGPPGAVRNGARPLARRHHLPGGRAMVGGFLVALAAVATFAAYLGATTGHAVRYVVARQSLRVGQRLEASDLATEPMSLPGSVGNGLAFRDPASLIGAVVVGPVRAGELVEAGDVSFGQHGLAERQLSFSVSLSHALDGALQTGDRVDVLATYGTGTDSSTQMVASGVEVVAVTEPSSLTAADGEPALVVTLSVPSAAEAVALAQAANAGQVTLVLSTGVAPPRVLPSSTPPTTQPAIATTPGAG
jgi:Flp pilus assembly protein CpaB